MFQLTLKRWLMAVFASVLLHISAVTVLNSQPPETGDERAAGGLSQVSVAITPSDYFPASSAEEVDASKPVEDTTEPDTAPDVAAKAVDAADIVRPVERVQPAQVEEIVERAEPQKSAPTETVANAPANPVEAPETESAKVALDTEVSETDTNEEKSVTEVKTVSKVKPRAEAQPKKAVKRKTAAKKKQPKKTKKKATRKGKKKRGAKRRKSKAASAASSSQRGNSKKRAGDGGRSNKAAGRAKLSSYLGRVQSKVRRQKRYPAAAKRKKQGGTVVVAFTITRGGGVSGLRLKRRSGNAALDREALAMVRRASPFPPIPRQTGRSRLAISIPIRFARR